MAKFKFRLKKVGEIKAIYEDQAKLKWAKAKQELLEAEDKLQALNDQRQTSLEYGYRNLPLQLRPDLYRYLEHMDQQIINQEHVCELAATKEKQEMAQWLEARKEKEMIVRLEEKEYEAYRQEMLRKEQAQLDELQNLVPQI